MATQTESIYTLNNGLSSVEMNRLDWQHRDVFRPATGTLLTDDIQKHLDSLGRPPDIADIGTGTGVWLRDLSTSLPPESQLDGFDFDTSKFPEQSLLPPNVKLAFGNALEPFPEELQGKYDLIHVRLFMYALKVGQWEGLAANLRPLLRPGGYLMWEDVGYPCTISLPITEAFQKLVNLDVRFAQHVGRDITAPVNLVHQFKSAGYTDCHQVIFSTFNSGKDVLKGGAEVIMTGVCHSLRGIVAKGGFDWAQKTEDIDELEKQLREDVANDVCALGFQIFRVIGRNP